MQQIEKTKDDRFKVIDYLWENNIQNIEQHKKEILSILDDLDSGTLRVASKVSGEWLVNQSVKKAVLLSFKLNCSKLINGSIKNTNWFDKVDSKLINWDEKRFIEAGFRAVPGCYIRHSAYIAKNVVIMPSFINVGAYIDEGTMIDTWSTVGSCAQIGKNCHISGGVGIGGVLEPLQANPVIIEDDCFIGARSEVAEGVIIRQGSVIGMGVYLSNSTKIIDRETGQIHYGNVPPYSVVISGTVKGKNDINTYAAIIVKKVDEQTKSKTSINELLRES